MLIYILKIGVYKIQRTRKIIWDCSKKKKKKRKSDIQSIRHYSAAETIVISLLEDSSTTQNTL